jgi:uncharacterized protein with HEPN domain
MQPDDRDAGYLWDMLEHARLAMELTQDVSFHRYSQDRVKQLALARVVEIIGEAARRVSTAYREAHPEIPWRKIIGQRNVLAHEYDEILHEVLWRTATIEVPTLATKIEMLLPPLPPDGEVQQ